MQNQVTLQCLGAEDEIIKFLCKDTVSCSILIRILLGNEGELGASIEDICRAIHIKSKSVVLRRLDWLEVKGLINKIITDPDENSHSFKVNFKSKLFNKRFDQDEKKNHTKKNTKEIEKILSENLDNNLETVGLVEESENNILEIHLTREYFKKFSRIQNNEKQGQIREIADKLFSTFTRLEEILLRKYLGYTNFSEEDYAKWMDQINLNKTKINSIRKKALLKLRHPNRVKYLIELGKYKK